MYKKDGSFTEYNGKRSVEIIVKYVFEFTHSEKQTDFDSNQHYSETKNEGCVVSGIVKTRKVPGYFFLEADSHIDSLNPSMTKISHHHI